MKKQILKTIYDCFEKWAQTQLFVCEKGCSTCCTQQVTITAVEGEIILDFIHEKGLQQWFAEKINSVGEPYTPPLTTNQFASNCFNGIDSPKEQPHQQNVCPFLENSSCTIYDARPFGCRCMNSEVRCSNNQPAQTVEHYLVASTAIYQLIEHLGQREYWGNMLDMLPAMCDMSRHAEIANTLQGDKSPTIRRLALRTADPLPGFMIKEEEMELINPLLQSIFTTPIDHRTIEEILNGKQ